MYEETISPVDAVSRADLPFDIFNPGGRAVNWLLSDNARGWLEERCGETDCTLESENIVRYCVDRSSTVMKNVIRSVTGILRATEFVPALRRRCF